MSTKEEGTLKDYIAIGVIGFAMATAIAGSGQIGGIFALFGANLGRSVAMQVVTGVFAYIPAAVTAAYLHYRWNKTESKMEGISVGIMIFLVHFVITLFMTVANTAIYAGDWGGAMQSWGLSVVFALVFYLLGGFLFTVFDSLKMPLPNALKFKRAPHEPAPPPPPGMTAQICPTCGGPLRYIQQYQRWYCDKEQKYA